MGKKTTYDQAVEDTKKLKKLVESNAVSTLKSVLAPTIKRTLREALSEGDDEMPDEPMPEDEEMEEADDDMGGDSKATIDLDKLSAEMEDEFKREAEGEDELDVDIEDEEEPVEEAKEEGEDEEEVEVSDEEVKEAFNAIMGEVESPPKGDPAQLDPNTDGKAVGLADKQKQQNDKPWDEVDPPAAEDFTQKESRYLQVITAATKKLAESDKRNKFLAKQIQEMRLDHTKLAYITGLFGKHQDVSRSVKEGIIVQFDNAKTLREAKLVYESARNMLSKMNKRSMTESRRSPRKNRSPVAPTTSSGKRSRQLSEHANVADRWKNLAGIKK